MELAIINQKIYTVRSVKIMLDRDLAELYEVETRVLNQSVKRNKELFPSDFMFQLTKEEYENMSSQIVMTSKTKRPNSALPFAFTEHGVRNNELLITLLKMYRDTLRKGYEVNRCLSAENLSPLHKTSFPSLFPLDLAR
ncbi:MAG: ORF6N domain-containing protein [Crocinitomicaceae bacterium]|nr:ORF6N domain-containing protein [Crocinitomicaceae bacterium]